MDVNLAKKYLIILLVILNLFLLFSIKNHNNNVSIDNPYFSKQTKQNFEKLISDRNISINTELPKSYDLMGIVDFKYEDITNKTRPELFLDFEKINSSNNFKKASLEIPNDDILVIRLKYDLSDKNSRKKFTQEFLNLYFNEQEFDLKIHTNSYIEYNPVFNNVIYEDSYIKFSFLEKYILVEMIMISPEKDVIERREVITPIEAILNILPSLESGDIIERIDLIYHFDLNEEELFKVKNARALPNWRIITNTGKVLYTFAFNR